MVTSRKIPIAVFFLIVITYQVLSCPFAFSKNKSVTKHLLGASDACVKIEICLDRNSLLDVRSTGTGFFCHVNGLIVTTNHTFLKMKRPDDEFDCYISDFRSDPREARKKFKAKMVFHENDVALIELVNVESAKLPPLLPWLNHEIPLGARIFCIGYPRNVFIIDYDPTVTSGVISHANRYVIINNKKEGPYIQTDAYSADGSSGSIVIDEQGNIVGMVGYSLTNDRDMWMGATYIIPNYVISSIVDKYLKGKNGVP